MHAVLAGAPANVRSIGELAPIVERCLARDPRDRYSNASELVDALATPDASSTGRGRSSDVTTIRTRAIAPLEEPDVRATDGSRPRDRADDRRTIKGSAIRALISYAVAHLGDASASTLLATLPGGPIDPSDYLPSAWYARDRAAILIRALVEPSSTASARSARLRAVGDFVAREHLDSTYRYLFSVMSPSKLIDMTPRIFGTYFAGVEVRTRNLAGGRVGVVDVRGLDDCDSIGDVACGWLDHAYRRSGADVADVTVSDAYGARERAVLTLEIRWA